MKTFLTVTLTLMLLAAELLTGNLGLSFALPIYGAICLYIAFGSVYGVSAAGMAALTADIIYDRPFPVWSIAALLILALSASAAERMQRKQPAASLAAGAVCGLLTALYNDLASVETFAVMIMNSGGGVVEIDTYTKPYEEVIIPEESTEE